MRMQPFCIAVCDDETADREKIADMAKEICNGEHIDCMITVYAEAKELLRALQGYEVSAARYLAKPVDENRLREAVLYCYGQYQKGRDLLLPINGGTRKVAPKDLLH